MITPQELLYTLVVPLLTCAALASLAIWRRWPWMFPLAAATGFLAGYSLLGVPSLPPRDGTDWLYWLTLPLAGVALLDTPRHRKWSWALGLLCGIVPFIVVHPLVRAGSISMSDLLIPCLSLAPAGAIACLLLDRAQRRIGAFATTASLVLTLAGTAVLILSSHLRIVALYALACTAALAPLPFFSVRVPTRGLTLLILPILAGFLAAGHYYPSPGLGWPHAAMLFAAPLLVWTGALLPTRKTWPKVLTALLAVAILVGAVAIPPALQAKQEAEADPYSAYR